jgi:hypothetical protein
LKWRGRVPYVFTGDHSFRFQASESTAGGTTFVNEEEFSGVLSGLMGGWALGGSMRTAFEALNGDLKKRVEGGDGSA